MKTLAQLRTTAILAALKIALAVIESENLDESHDGETEIIRDAIDRAEGLPPKIRPYPDGTIGAKR